MHCCACIGALACSSVILVYNLQSVFQQACKHTGLQLVSACDCFAFWSWDATLWHICLYSALRLGLFGQFAVYEIVFSKCMSSSSSYPRQLFSGQNSFCFVIAVNVFSQSCQASSIFMLNKVHPSQNTTLHCNSLNMGCMNNTFPHDCQSHTHCGHLRWTVGEQQIITSWNSTSRPDE